MKSPKPSQAGLGATVYYFPLIKKIILLLKHMVKNNTPFLGGPPGMATQVGTAQCTAFATVRGQPWPPAPETTLPTVPGVTPGRYRHISK